MKKLIYLFLALIIVACSSDDDSSSGQTIFEKYDGVVWQEDTPNNYLFRIQHIVNGNLITANTFFVEEEGSEDCESSTLPISDFFDVSENSYSLNEQEEYDGDIETWWRDINTAWNQYFYNGNQYGYNELSSANVRAVRAF